MLGTAQVRDSTDEQLVRLWTGDGMALVFHHSAEEPARCALEIAEALRKHPEIPVRMGIPSGPVSEVTDVSGRRNNAGAGIKMAQRVMDCGDAGHILFSQHVAADLVQYRQWAPRLRDLGEWEVKHGVRLHLVDLYAEPLGNPEPPEKFREARHKAAAPAKSSSAKWIVAVAAAIVIAGVVAVLVVRMVGTDRRAVRSPTTTEGRPGGASLPIPEKSIAVLAFENLSEEKANTFFTDGVQDEILTDLAKIADVKVISRASVMQYKTGVARNLRKIGEELGVAHVVEGSVQRAANKVRVNAQLIDVRTDAHLWAQTYDRDLADVFAIQSEIAKEIADQLQAKLSPNEKKAIEQPPTTDLAAFDLYSRAKSLLLTASFSLTNEPDLH
ncbi:MAG: FlgO family outer membrane protein, partial [Candidatus Udaeobacter sp.]